MLRCGIWEQGQISYPIGTAVSGQSLANVFLHEFDDWYVRTYRLRPEWEHLAFITAISAQEEIGGTLMLTRYADDWVAWNGSRDRAEEIKAEIKAFLANVLKLKLSEERPSSPTLTMASILGYQIQGDKRWSDGQWCLFSRVPQRRRFRDAVKAITQNTFTDEVAFTALSGLIRGWGNYYAYAADSRLMDSLDAFIYQEVWKYCLHKSGGRQNQPTAGTRCLVTFAKSVTSKLVLS